MRRGSFVWGPVVLLACAAAGPAPRAPTPLEELRVTPARECLSSKLDLKAPRPQVVSTWPAPGATVRPGVIVIRVTFDRPMTCRGFFAELPPAPSPCPMQRQNLVLSYDRRIARILCATRPDTSYAVRVGQGPGQLFVSVFGRVADPVELPFRTSAGPPIETVSEALAQDVELAKPAT